MARRGAAKWNPADESPYRSPAARPASLNPADQSPYRSSYSPAPDRGSSSADERNPAAPSFSGQGLARRRTRPPPLETVTPISPAAPTSARKATPRDAPPRRAADPMPHPIKSPQTKSLNRPLDMGPAEVRLHAENAQAVARLHAEHSQRIAQLLLGTIECRPLDLEDGLASPSLLKAQRNDAGLCGSLCGVGADAKSLWAGGPSAAALQSRRQEISRLNALHAQALAKQEALHARQLAMLQVEVRQKDLSGMGRASPR